jgi:glycosyltransferase involved in cell wall biosynthesis
VRDHALPVGAAVIDKQPETIRILIVHHATALGGAEHSLLVLLRHLDRTRFVVHLATQPGVLAAAARQLRVTVHEVPLARLRGEPAAPWRFARGVAALMRTITREDVALVYANTMRASLYALPAAWFTRRPLVCHVHDIFAPGLYVRTMCALSTAVIAVSAAAAKPLPCTQKVHVVHNGLHFPDFQGDRREPAARLRAAWGVPPAATVIGQVARLQPWKGQRDFIAVAENLLQTLPDVYFVIVGGDIFADARAYEEELKATVARRNLSHRVIFAGHQEDVAAVLNALDVLVHASTDEPFGRILIEAGAVGLPVVAYGGGGVSEILVDGRTALVVPPGDRTAPAAALRRVVGDPALARALGDAARADICARFDARALTRAAERVLESAIRI